MILIALGANLSSPAGQPAATLLAALDALTDLGITIEKRSGFYETAAWPDPADPPYVNAVARIRTSLSPADLLRTLHEVEGRFGRRRDRVNAPRSLDLDLLDYDGRVEIGPPELPHPRMDGRRFVLIPLRDVAPDWHHPVSGQGLPELIAKASPAEVMLISRRG